MDFKRFYTILRQDSHWNYMTRMLEIFSHAFYVMTGVLLVFLPYDNLKMVTTVTETCCNK